MDFCLTSTKGTKRFIFISNKQTCFRFNTSSHVYFATVQKKSYLPGEAEAGYVTRISRICINDPNFNTYSEVTLQCHLGGENYNLLQAAVTVPASKKVRKLARNFQESRILIKILWLILATILTCFAADCNCVKSPSCHFVTKIFQTCEMFSLHFSNFINLICSTTFGLNL